MAEGWDSEVHKDSLNSELQRGLPGCLTSTMAAQFTSLNLAHQGGLLGPMDCRAR